MTNDLIDLVRDLNSRRSPISTYRRYYDGDQPVTFVGSKLQTSFGEKLKNLNANRCAAVVDLIADRLRIAGFTEPDASEFWTANNLDQLANETHQEVLTTGDAYVVVMPDRSGTPTLHAQHSERMAVLYDEEDQRTIRVAAKTWRLRDGRWRMNLYFADRLEKYVTAKSESEELPDRSERWLRHQEVGDPSWPIGLQWSRVPVFHFANNARSGSYGRSEIAAIIPLQDRLNLTLANQTISEETQAFKQRWAVGIQPIIDEATGRYLSPFKVGEAGSIWTAADHNVKFGEFSATDLTQFETVTEGHELRIARTARVPIHYLLQTGSPPSGEALKTAEAPLIAKIEDRQMSFGSVWTQIMRFVLELQGTKSVSLATLWKDAATRSESESWKNAIIKNEMGVSQRQILLEAGYSDEQIGRFSDEITANADAVGGAILRGFDAA